MEKVSKRFFSVHKPRGGPAIGSLSLCTVIAKTARVGLLVIRIKVSALKQANSLNDPLFTNELFQ